MRIYCSGTLPSMLSCEVFLRTDHQANKDSPKTSGMLADPELEAWGGGATSNLSEATSASSDLAIMASASASFSA